MQIGGFIPFSLIDYPELVSAVIFTSGCNFRCPYCHNPELVNSPTTIDINLNDIWSLLAKRKNLLDGVVVSGGEPTIQPDLLSFLEKIKTIGYKIKLDTNGSNPQVLSEAIEKGLLDYIAMDIKSPLNQYSNFTKVKKVKKTKTDLQKINDSIEIIYKSQIPFEFRMTAVKPLHKFNDLIEVGKTADSPSGRFIIQNFKNGNLLDSHFSKKAQSFEEKELLAAKDTLTSMGVNCYIR